MPVDGVKSRRGKIHSVHTVAHCVTSEQLAVSAAGVSGMRRASSVTVKVGRKVNGSIVEEKRDKARIHGKITYPRIATS